MRLIEIRPEPISRFAGKLTMWKKSVRLDGSTQTLKKGHEQEIKLKVLAVSHSCIVFERQAQRGRRLQNTGLPRDMQKDRRLPGK